MIPSSSGDQYEICAQSTKNDVRDMINDVTGDKDDPQKIVQAIEKGL